MNTQTQQGAQFVREYGASSLTRRLRWVLRVYESETGGRNADEAAAELDKVERLLDELATRTPAVSTPSSPANTQTP